VSIAAARLSKWLDGFAAGHGQLSTEPGPTQVLVSAADGSRVWIEVPFPPWECDSARPLTSLQAHVSRPRKVGVLLVRRGGYAAGVFDGSTLLSSKVGSSYVQGTTKAGGWSQQRYARRRDNQSRAAFAEAAEVATRVLLPAVVGMDALICGGDRGAVSAALSDPRLAPLLPLRCEPFLAVPDPRLRVLQSAPEKFLVINLHVHP